MVVRHLITKEQWQHIVMFNNYYIWYRKCKLLFCFCVFFVQNASNERTMEKSSIFWDIMPCSPLKVNQRFRGTYSSKTSANSQWTTQCYIPEGRTLHNHGCENIKSYNTQWRVQVHVSQKVLRFWLNLVLKSLHYTLSSKCQYNLCYMGSNQIILILSKRFLIQDRCCHSC
jgi:hypothetical protein